MTADPAAAFWLHPDWDASALSGLPFWCHPPKLPAPLCEQCGAPATGWQIRYTCALYDADDIAHGAAICRSCARRADFPLAPVRTKYTSPPTPPAL